MLLSVPRLLGGEKRTVSYSVIGLVLNRLLSSVPEIALVAIVVIGTSVDASAERSSSEIPTTR
jgi:hypothetical protein